MNVNQFLEQFDKLINGIYRYQDSHESVSDIKDKIYIFLNQNYDVYLKSNPKEREEIRELVKKHHTNPESPYLLDLLLIGYVQTAARNIESTGDRKWLMRGLAIASIANSLLDQRDDTFSLAYLYVMAEEKNLNPMPEFHAIAELSSEEISSGGHISMKELINDIPNIAHKTYEDWKDFS